MASRTGAIRAGRAFVEFFAEDSKLIRGLRRVQMRLKAVGKTLTRLGAGIAGFGVVGLTSFAPMIKAAGDAQETISRFRAVFKDQSEAAEDFAERLAKSIGRSKLAIQDSLASFQAFFVGLGFSGDQSRDLSQSMQSLALDFASFNNIADADAMGRFISVLSGSSEVVDRFGINLKVAAIDQELLRQGINKTAQQATEQEKALARVAIILRAMTEQGALGDAERTSGSFANQMKRLKATIGELKVSIGQALIPVLTPLVTKIGQVVTVISDFAKKNPQVTATIFKVFAAITALGGALLVLGTAGFALSGLVGGFATLLNFVNPLTIAIAALAAGVTLFFTKTETGNRILDSLIEKLKTLKPLLSALQTAFNAGDFELLGRLLQQTFEVALAFVQLKAVETWNAIKNFGLDAWDILVSGLAKAFVNIFAVIEKAWINAVAAFQAHWDRFAFGLIGSDLFQRLFPDAAAAVLPDRQQAMAERRRRFAEIDQRTAGATDIIDANRDRRILDRERHARERERKLSENLQQKLDQLNATIAEANNLPLTGVAATAAGVGGGGGMPAVDETTRRAQEQLGRMVQAAEVGTGEFQRLVARATTGAGETIQKKQKDELTKQTALSEQQLKQLEEIKRKVGLPEVGTI